MKKLIMFGVVLAGLMMTMLPLGVLGDCGECHTDTECPVGCCLVAYCAEVTNWYRVSYSEAVYLEFEEWGIGYWSSQWVSMYVFAHDRESAAELLGLDAGRNCFVGRVIGYQVE